MKTKATSTNRKHAILCISLMAGLSLTATAQVKVGDNPNQIVSGARLQVDGDNTTTTASKLIVTGTGNVGLGTAAPATSLHVLSTGTGGTGVFTANTANMALRLENSGNGQAVIQHLLAKDAGGVTKQMIMGINPTFLSGNGAFLITRDGSVNDLIMNLVDGNLGIGGNPSTTQKLSVTGSIHASGNLSVGTTASHAQLQLASTIVPRKIILYESADNDNQFHGFGVGTGLLRYQVGETSSAHVFFAGSSATTSTELFRINGNGNATLAGSLTQNSDIRLKKDIVDNTYGLKEILKLRTINYRFKDEARGKDKKVGFIAQEVKAAMPELVSTASDDMKTLSVSYAEMTAVLTKAIQEQQAQIEKLTAALEKTTARNEQLEEQYNELRAEVKTIKTEVVSEKYVVK